MQALREALVSAPAARGSAVSLALSCLLAQQAVVRRLALEQLEQVVMQQLARQTVPVLQKAEVVSGLLHRHTYRVAD